MAERFELAISLFGEGGGASGGAAAGASGEGAQAAEAAQQTPDRAAEFDAMIKGEYKAEYDKRFKAGLDRRFRETESLRQQTEAARPLMELLAGKYGVDAADVEGLLKAAEADESYYESEAAEKGLSVQQLKEFKRLERENAQFKRASEERQRIERANQVQARWAQETEAVKGVYPTFDFDTESQNAQFMHLLTSGVGVRTAYEVIHNDEIISGAMQFATQKTQKQTVDNIRARGMRPDEGGLGTHPAGEGQLDVSKLTKQQRADMARRALRGEKITL